MIKFLILNTLNFIFSGLLQLINVVASVLLRRILTKILGEAQMQFYIQKKIYVPQRNWCSQPHIINNHNEIIRLSFEGILYHMSVHL